MLVVHPENRVGGTAEAIRHSDCARQTPELLGPGKGTKCRTTRVPEPEWHRLGRCMKPRAGLGWFRRSNLEPEQCGQGGHTRPEQGQTQCG